MNLNKLNIKCCRIIFLYQNRMNKTFTSNLRKELVKSIVEINKEINYDVISKCSEKVRENFNILLYSIIFKEELIDNEIILKLLNTNLIDHKSLSNLIDSILTMKRGLTNEIISKILIINAKSYLKMPYDYRFHILKRREINKEIKQEILKTYNDYEIEEMLNIIKSNLDEMPIFYENKNLEKSDELTNILYEQYVYYILKEYQENLKNKKTSI